MTKYTLSLTVASALYFSGCAIGPDYSRPEVAVPQQFLNSDANTSVQKTLDLQWWKQFNDERLSASVETALNANYDLQISQASVDALLGQFDQAKSYLYPQIDASGSLTRKGTYNAASGGRNLYNGVTSTYAGSLSLASYEIDLFGKVRRANEAARAALLSSEYAKESVKLSIVSNVAASYVKLSSLSSQIKLANENVTVTSEILRITELKYKHGVIAETEYLQAQSEYEKAQATYSQLEASKIAEEATFNLLLGRNPARVETNALDSITLPEVPDALPSSILQHRPDIASAEQNLISANAQIGVARAQYYPSFKLTGMLGVQSLELSDFLSNPARLWEVAPSVSVPIFSAGLIAGKIKTAEADRDQMLATYKKAIVSAFNDTDNALGQTQKAKEQVQYQAKSSSSIKKALEQAKLRYQVGTISYDDMLSVQQQWLQAEQSYIIAKQNALVSTISLYKALGGGWEEENSADMIPDLLPAGR
ncbi:MAG: efflux transporter outer membrane subunit [Sulfuricurvum sp.]|uniref:efflux transporter outer membrane subunit n=2 Tax=Sulfuricurvum TaxID=286130 RepID=UPI0026372C14|nr:efflux transporter outer membrane subunit [Sulfuricurvum sp.]MDD3596515.1 efflux transporter outer membrane subunit [Sulfuricurvum sp.]MDD4883252.1 efflux transporter outer membrane subunit [Sulfuricurvum sp.]